MGLSRSTSSQAPGSPAGRERPVERFKPTTGTLVGYAGLLVAAFAVGYSALYVHSLVGLRIALAALFAAVLIWVSQLRPRVTAYPRTLHMKGSLRDAYIPYVLIDEVAMAQTLNVWVGERRYMCIGIGLSLGTDIRQRAKKQRQGSLLGSSRSNEFSERADRAAPDQTAMSYQTFVVTRIQELVEQARKEMHRRGESADSVEVRRAYAVPEIVALVVTGLAFVATLLV